MASLNLFKILGSEGKMLKFNFLQVVFILTLLVTLPLSAEMYQWTDEDGIMHFSDEPPEENKNTQEDNYIPLKKDKLKTPNNFDSTKAKEDYLSGIQAYSTILLMLKRMGF